MQGNRSLNDGRITDGAFLTLPVGIVEWVRRGAFAQIGSTAEALDRAAFARERERPEWFRAQIENMRETCALLETVGWAEPARPMDVRVDLCRDGWALMRVLYETLEFAEADAHEAIPPPGSVGPGEPTARFGVLSCEQARECAGVLCEPIAAAGAHIDALAVQEGAALAEAA